MRLLADMGISPSTVKKLNTAGHDASHVRDYEMHCSSDKDILERAKTEGRTLLTADMDFGYLMAISNASLPSVIMFRLSDMRPNNVLSHLTRVLNRYKDQLTSGAFIVVADRTVRVRTLPFGGSF